MLKYYTDLPSSLPPCLTFQMCEVGSGDHHAAFIRLLNAADAAQQGALARAAEADHALNGSARNLEIDPGQASIK
jgi:hypothetical protein